jgi:hypothetical protein
MTFLQAGPSFLDYKTYYKASGLLDFPYTIQEKATAQTYPHFLAEKTIALATIHLPWVSALKDH